MKSRVDDNWGMKVLYIKKVVCEVFFSCESVKETCKSNFHKPLIVCHDLT